MRDEDLWLMSRTERAINSVTSAIEAYKIHESVRALRSFLVDDLSHNYIRLVRRRTWVEKENTGQARWVCRPVPCASSSRTNDGAFHSICR